MRQIFRNIYYSFPVQLLLLHLKMHYLLITIWVILAALMSGTIARSFGIKYLFLDPEYIGNVNFWSYLFIGIAFGGFLMTWNITTYLLNSFRFPFLASLSRPFLKYCINNSLIPILFIGFYFGSLVHFQYYNEYAAEYDILRYCLGFLVGLSLSLLGNIFYFIFTNKDILKFLRSQRRKPPGRIVTQASARALQESKNYLTPNKQRIKYYFTEHLQIRLVRSVAHYQPTILLKVFKQHHINAFVYQIFIMLLLFMLALMMDNEVLRIPAGASILILFAFVISISGAFKYWLGTWRILVLIILMMLLNTVTADNSAGYKNKVYGINYTGRKAIYDYEALERLTTSENIEKDKENTIAILEAWKAKNYDAEKDTVLPKMVFLSTSGGGMRAALWATRVIQTLEKETEGALMKQTTLMTGASGGMIGSTYMRDVYLQQVLNGQATFDQEIHLNRMSKDLQNALAFVIVTNDIFIPAQKFKAEGYTYRKDRGYIFEEQLRALDTNYLNRSLADYTTFEQSATIPLLFYTPTVVNDVKSLVIASQPVSYMMLPPNQSDHQVEIDGIDYGQFFQHQNSYQLRITSAVRMNATYPYILPNVHLPSVPALEVMDAGFKDNYGIDAAIRFIHVFKDWIRENTSGVVIVQVRGDEKIKPMEDYHQGIVERVINPIGVAGQFPSTQDYFHDDKIALMNDLLGDVKISLVPFIYRPSKMNERASMSFHLTAREKNDILGAIDLEGNQASIERLKQLLK